MYKETNFFNEKKQALKQLKLIQPNKLFKNGCNFIKSVNKTRKILQSQYYLE